MQSGPNRSREFTAYGERWKVVRHPPIPVPAVHATIDSPSVPPGGLVFTSEGGEQRRLCVMHENSFPTQREFTLLTEPDFIRLLERAAPEGGDATSNA